MEKFKETILNNYIFDQDDFIKNLNWALYNSNLEISKQFNSQKENYKSKLLEILTFNFTKDELIHRINELYLVSYNNFLLILFLEFIFRKLILSCFIILLFILLFKF